VAPLSYGTDFSVGLGAGYGQGFTLRGTGTVFNFAQGFPLGLDFAITYTPIDPGNALGARRVFIANATNGTPEKYGETWDLRMDFLYKVPLLGPHASFLYAGVRRTFFDGTFRYVGANEEFDVTGQEWGVGIGGKGLFSITPRLDLALTLGVDAYFDGPLHGHDTTYSPNNDNVNPHENFTYKDASSVINMPKILPVLIIGLSYNI
jgi:hypothetical protein